MICHCGINFQIVKYKVRYVSDRIKDGEEDDRTSSNILDEIGKCVLEIKLDLFREFKKSELVLYRGRVHSCKHRSINENDFYPPSDKATTGRMNPDGIAMFYSALNHSTIQEELYSEVNNWLSIAEFMNTKKLMFLDLTDLDSSKLPSIFDIYIYIYIY